MNGHRKLHDSEEIVQSKARHQSNVDHNIKTYLKLLKDVHFKDVVLKVPLTFKHLKKDKKIGLFVNILMKEMQPTNEEDFLDRLNSVLINSFKEKQNILKSQKVQKFVSKFKMIVVQHPKSSSKIVFKIFKDNLVIENGNEKFVVNLKTGKLRYKERQEKNSRKSLESSNEEGEVSSSFSTDKPLDSKKKSAKILMLPAGYRKDSLDNHNPEEMFGIGEISAYSQNAFSSGVETIQKEFNPENLEPETENYENVGDEIVPSQNSDTPPVNEFAIDQESPNKYYEYKIDSPSDDGSSTSENFVKSEADDYFKVFLESFGKLYHDSQKNKNVLQDTDEDSKQHSLEYTDNLHEENDIEDIYDELLQPPTETEDNPENSNFLLEINQKENDVSLGDSNVDINEDDGIDYTTVIEYIDYSLNNYKHNTNTYDPQTDSY